MHIWSVLQRNAYSVGSLLQNCRRFGTSHSSNREHNTMNSSGLPTSFLPPVNRDMKVLDRSFFSKTVPTSAITVFDPKRIQDVKKQLTRSKDVLLLQNVRSVQNDESLSGAKRILLDPEIQVDKPETWSDVLSKFEAEGIGKICPHEIHLTYDNWTMSHILEAVLPQTSEADEELPSSFAQIGHVAHMNLRQENLPYKHLIGQVLLDKNPTIKTVINKILNVGSDSVFRTFPYEVLAGPDDMNVVVTQSSCEFHFDYSQVYWNTRLGHEHERICALFKPGEAVCDVMAGVGPFAIPAAKSGVWVHANDLNPACYEALLRAIKINKVTPYVKASCMDGRQFIKEATSNLVKTPRSVKVEPKIKISRHLTNEDKLLLQEKKEMSTRIEHEPKCFDHYVMNLPATAVEFLDAFRGLFRGRESEFLPHSDRKLPFIHVYLFQKRLDSSQQESNEVLQNISTHLGAQVALEDAELEVNVFDVRLVAPTKKYFCVSFRLPPSTAFAET